MDCMRECYNSNIIGLFGSVKAGNVFCKMQVIEQSAGRSKIVAKYC